MKRAWFRQLAAVWLCVTLVFFSGCGGGSIHKASAEFSDTYNASDTWLVYWYVCGTDLESGSGAASEDLKELQQVKLPANVKVIIQTGGSKQWQTQGIPANAIGRYLYDSDGLHAVASLPDADMGSRDTLASFLQFGKDNYQADHRVFVFWDHGGGTAAGVCLDERTQHILSLDDVRNAFTAVHTPDEGNPPFELVGFDACLMATIDMAQSLSGVARYMVGSEELEPGNGWAYTGWVGALAKNPAMNGAGLGKAICDSYIDDCQRYDTAQAATLSVTDLSKLPALRAAYDAFGTEALKSAAGDPRRFFSGFAREAESAENYGGNTREQGFTNMVDLGSLANNAKGLLPQSTGNLLAALNDSVIYKVSGPYRPHASGLSCYYSYNGDIDSYRQYANLSSPSMPFKCLYYYLISGQMPPEAQQYLNGTVPQSGGSGGFDTGSQGGASAGGGNIAGPASQGGQSTGGSIADSVTGGGQAVFAVDSLEDTPVDIDQDGTAFCRLSPAAMDILSSVHCQFLYFSQKDNLILYLGSDSNIDADWDKGIFKDNFQGKWPMLDGHPVYIEITHEGDGYNMYAVPVKLNGVECNLQIVYNFHDEKYVILGARRGLETNGMGSRQLIKLKAGDTITTLHYAMSLRGSDEEFQQFDVDTFTIGDSPKFDDEAVGDGKYAYYFEFVDPLNKTSLSQMVTYTISGGQIVTSVGEDMNGNSTAPDTGNAGGFTNISAGGAGYGGSTGGSIADQMGGNGGGYDSGYGSGMGGGSTGGSTGGGSIADQLGR